MQGIHVPNHFNAYQLITQRAGYPYLSDLIPSLNICDFIFIDTLNTPLGESEYLNLYEFLLHAQKEEVNWCLRCPVSAHLVEDVFQGANGIHISAIHASKNGKGFFRCYLVTTYPTTVSYILTLSVSCLSLAFVTFHNIST